MKKVTLLLLFAVAFFSISYAQSSTNKKYIDNSIKQAIYDITLKAVGQNKPAVIKVLISKLQITETQAHALINNMPAIIGRGLSKADATALETALVQAGATVLVKAN
jgi:large subunit ribosomal protein L7/L12